MIRHLFKLIWNRKRSNFLIIVEILFSFIVLFGVTTLFTYYVQNYQKPIGFNFENVWVLEIQTHEIPDAEKRQRLEQLVMRLDAFKEVSHVALGSENVPYSGNTWTSGIARNNRDISANTIIVQHDAFKDVMELTMTEGRWFNESDAFSNKNLLLSHRM